MSKLAGSVGYGLRSAPMKPGALSLGSVCFTTGPELAFGPEELAFTVNDFLDTPGRSYDVTSDGQLLYTLKRSQPAIVNRVHVISNWQAGLK